MEMDIKNMLRLMVYILFKNLLIKAFFWYNKSIEIVT